MTIRRFIQLSDQFRGSADAGEPSVLLGRILPRSYEELGVHDRLRIHGIIDKEDYLQKPPVQFKGTAPEDIVHTLESLYHLMLRENVKDLLLAMNKKGALEENFRKVTVFGCIPVYIALDLSHARSNTPVPAYPPPLRAV